MVPREGLITRFFPYPNTKGSPNPKPGPDPIPNSKLKSLT